MFQLEASETLSAGLRRLLLQQIDLGLGQVTTSRDLLHIRVHEARKAFKRCRALIRFVRHELGQGIYGDLNRTFRDAGRVLAAHRTDWVLRELVGRFRAEAEDPVVTLAFTRLGGALAGAAAEDAERLDGDGRLARDLDRTRERVAGWPVVRDDFDLVRPGLFRVYRTGRRRMGAARRDPSGERFHEWRKVVKYVWHQTEVLTPINRASLEPFAQTVHSLADLLGDEHDLCDLIRAARREGALASEVELQAVERRLEEERSRIHQETWPIAEVVFGDEPREFAGRLAGYWSAWRVEVVPQGAARYGV